MMCGASIPEIAWRITLKLSWPAVFATLLILFVRAMESFEVPALLGIIGPRSTCWTVTFPTGGAQTFAGGSAPPIRRRR